MVFLDTNGDKITVCSNAPLLCKAVIEKAREQCKKEFLDQLKTAKIEKSPHMHSCYLGVLNFFIPIYFNNEIVAFCVGGGVASDSCALEKDLMDAYYVVHKNREDFEKIMNNISLSMSLINVDLEKTFIDLYSSKGNENRDIFEGKLSRREKEVALAICKGYTNKQVADELFISEKTVKSHMSRILLKLNLRDRVELVVKYLRYQ